VPVAGRGHRSDRRLHVMLRVLFGVRDLRADLHANIEASLERIARIAEGAPATPRTGPGRTTLQ
jgi:hypothetical protein